MNEISVEESKRIMTNILKYIDEICRKNDIKYTLIGGSLIGAVRHNGIIPWDDDIDIDIGLLPNDYENLIKCLKNSDSKTYKLLDMNTEPTYYYPYAKIVDTRTICIESNLKKINNYGIFVDIFKYNKIPNDINEIKKYYNKCMNYRKLLYKSIVINSDNFIKKIYHKIIGNLINIKNTRIITNKYIEFSEKYNDTNDTNVMINWTPYGAEKETHSISNFDNYIDVNFENINAMIIEDYDMVLKRVFGDYMTPPPLEKQVPQHNMKIYWKER